MPTREEYSREIKERRGAAGDERQGTALEQVMEQLNGAVAELDDELASIVEKLAWLSKVNWTNQRPVAEFGTFVETKIGECEAQMASIRARWQTEWAEQSGGADVPQSMPSAAPRR